MAIATPPVAASQTRCSPRGLKKELLIQTALPLSLSRLATQFRWQSQSTNRVLVIRQPSGHLSPRANHVHCDRQHPLQVLSDIASTTVQNFNQDVDKPNATSPTYLICYHVWTKPIWLVDFTQSAGAPQRLLSVWTLIGEQCPTYCCPKVVGLVSLLARGRGALFGSRGPLLMSNSLPT